MGRYLYVEEGNNKVHEIEMSLSEMSDWVDNEDIRAREIELPNGKKALRSIALEAVGFSHTPSNWPMVSEAAGCHPSQIRESQEYLAKKGIHTDYTKDGNPIFKSEKHKAQVCRAFGLYDKNAGYHGAAPLNF